MCESAHTHLSPLLNLPGPLIIVPFLGNPNGEHCAPGRAKAASLWAVLALLSAEVNVNVRVAENSRFVR
jgi:hypothetical protein